MKALFKKSIALLLSAILLFTAVPFAASAATTAEQSVGASSGTTGSCTWTLDDNGTLTISGNGAMGYYSSVGPWGNSIKSLIIENGVTSIGKMAFENCTILTSVTIGNSVTSIEYGAFAMCTGLTSVTVPDSVTSIGFAAFTDCTGLTSVTIGNSVTSIGSNAFNGCTGLTSVTIPDSVTSIEESAFLCCTNLTSVTIPDSVTIIGDGAFMYCQRISDVYYGGNEAQWNSINIDNNNDCLTSATINYSAINISDNAVEFNGHFYKAFFQTVTWKNAKILCEEMGGHLATVTSKEENDFVYGLIKNKGVVCWLGGTDEAVEGEWKWITGEEWSYYPAEYGFDNCYGKQHYLVTGYECKNFWDDQSNEQGILCNSEGFICEWDENVLYGMEDTYSFGNLSDKIPKKIYYDTFGKTMITEMLYFENKGYGGQCYGMATTAIASSVYNSPSASTYSRQIFNANRLNEIRPDWKSSETGISVSDYIKYGFIFQYSDIIAQEKEQNRIILQNDLGVLYNSINDYLCKNGEPIVIGIRGNYKGNDSGHALWALGIGENNNNHTEIIVYDCNEPKKPHSLWLNKLNGKYISWSYQHPNLDITWGTDLDKYASIYFSTPAKEFIEFFSNIQNHKTNYDYLVCTSDINIGFWDKLDNNEINLSSIENTEKIIPIKVDSLNFTFSNNMYWANLSNDIQFSSTDTALDVSISSSETSLKLSAPEDSTANIKTKNLEMDSVNFELSGNKTFGVAFNRIDNSGDPSSVLLSGVGTSDVSTEQTDDGVIINGAESISVIHDETVYEDTVYQLNGEKNSLIQNNDGAPVILEDSDNDGTYDSEVDPKLIGDTNLDGKVDIRDITAIQRHIAELETITDEKALVADTNLDGELDISDATWGQMYIAKYFESFLKPNSESESEENNEDKYVYFKNSDSWTDVKAHMWSDESEKDLDGTEMEQIEDDVYRVVVPDDAMWIQFSGNNGTVQTEEMQIVDYGLIFEDELWKEYLYNSNN